jgi:hypothetical protein
MFHISARRAFNQIPSWNASTRGFNLALVEEYVTDICFALFHDTREPEKTQIATLGGSILRVVAPRSIAVDLQKLVWLSDLQGEFQVSCSLKVLPDLFKFVPVSHAWLDRVASKVRSRLDTAKLIFVLVS